MKTLAEKKERARQIGAEDFHRGMPVTYNPFDPKSRRRDPVTQVRRYLRDSWHSGWSEARRQSKEPKP